MERVVYEERIVEVNPQPQPRSSKFVVWWVGRTWRGVVSLSLSSEHGTCTTVKARFWLWRSGRQVEVPVEVERVVCEERIVEVTPSPAEEPHTSNSRPLSPEPQTLNSAPGTPVNH